MFKGFLGRRLGFSLALTGLAGAAVFGISGALPTRALPPATSPNAISNRDMSKGDVRPDGWALGWVGSGKIEAVRDTTVFKSAPASLCVRSVGGRALGGATH